MKPGLKVRVLLPLTLAVCALLAAAGKQNPSSVGGAKAFIEAAEAELLNLSTEAQRADWVKSTYITDDTEILAARADERAIAATVKLAKESTRFDSLRLPEDVARKMKLLKLSLTLATPSDPKEAEELTRIVSSMEGTYGKGKYCPPGKDRCLDLGDLRRIMAENRDANELLDVWRGWHAIAPLIRKDFVRYAQLANKGARELGFADNGAMWRAKYDMPRRSLPASSTVYGSRSARFTFRFTPTSATGCTRNTAPKSYPPTGPSRRTC